jgi:hypothetical protein
MKLAGYSLVPLALLCLAACDRSDEVPDAEPGPTKEQAAQDAAPLFASTYTDFDLEKCDVLSEEREEGSSATFQCHGFGKAAIFVQEGDGRFDLDAGVDDDGFQTISAFNDIGDTIEWRLEGGEPFAVIFRFKDVSLETGQAGRTVLAVETVGRSGSPGCRVVQIAGNTPDANQKAREFADATRKAEFSCPQQPEMVGQAG